MKTLTVEQNLLGQLYELESQIKNHPESNESVELLDKMIKDLETLIQDEQLIPLI